MEEKPQDARTGGGDARHVAVDQHDAKPHEHRMLPVWFFVGIILLIYGVMILVTGIAEYASPPATVLANLHPAVWWGGLLTVIGAVYVSTYWPRKA
jgi:hypothetical protein